MKISDLEQKKQVAFIDAVKELVNFIGDWEKCYEIMIYNSGVIGRDNKPVSSFMVAINTIYFQEIEVALLEGQDTILIKSWGTAEQWDRPFYEANLEDASSLQLHDLIKRVKEVSQFADLGESGIYLTRTGEDLETILNSGGLSIKSLGVKNQLQDFMLSRVEYYREGVKMVFIGDLPDKETYKEVLLTNY